MLDLHMVQRAGVNQDTFQNGMRSKRDSGKMGKAGDISNETLVQAIRRPHRDRRGPPRGVTFFSGVV